MKKLLLLFSALLLAFNLSAQDYDFYLRKAYSALEEGKTETAQRFYNVYKDVNKKVDLDFENLLKDKIENDWKKSCHIIDLGDGYSLAVQKRSIQNILNYEDANSFCEASRLGGYTDWRLPTQSELLNYFSTFINTANTVKDYYWTKGYGQEFVILNGIKYRRTYYTTVNQYGMSDDMMHQEKLINGKYCHDFLNGNSLLNKFVIVRKFKQ